MRERYRGGRIQHAESWGRLTGQLRSLKYRFSSSGQQVVDRKDDLRWRGQISPDWACAVCLAFALLVGLMRRPVLLGNHRPAPRL